ncbi:MAG: glutamate synthase subunit alpha, partial [Actinobacteria bacterium]|nr:glutamate synthase subunit alpha [Actinomycetota bacterium]
MRSAVRPELDACGIGFVADAEARPSRSIVAAAIGGLACVKHRGAVAADARSADGSGLLTPIPAALFGAGHGVASLFVRGPDPRRAIEAAAAAEGLELVDWRVPPTDEAHLGDSARASQPAMLQVTFTGPPHPDGNGSFPPADERRAYRFRRRIEATTENAYVVSCSFRTIVYKGLFVGDELGRFYADLRADDLDARYAIFHQRYSTNTFPSWRLAQPFGFVAHNGEINTVRANREAMRGRRADLGAGSWW